MLLLGALCALGSVAPSARADDANCLKCHTNRAELTQALTDKTRAVESLLVDIQQLKGSAHASRSCADCHFDFDTRPHGDDAETAACGDCHDKQLEQHNESLHGKAFARGDKLAPTCVTCHGTHGVLPHKDPKSPTATLNIPKLCGTCHHEGSAVSVTHDIPQDKIFENYSQSIHGEGLFKKGLSVTAVCISCHTSHFILSHEDKRSSIHRDNVAATCTVCHSQIEQVHRQVIEGHLWKTASDKIPSCVECHSPHKVRREGLYPSRMVNKDCFVCHGKQDLAVERNGKQVSLFMDEARYATSMHNKTACAQCHTEVTSSLTRPCETIKSKVDCAVCHADQVLDYRGSTHGTLWAKGDTDAPHCGDCHDLHATLGKTDPKSPTFPRNVPQLCSQCHREGGQAAKRIQEQGGANGNIVSGYLMSIHGKGLKESGLIVTATCVNCHTPHSELPPSDPRSTVHASRIAGTCGTCHQGIEADFLNSAHAPGYSDTKRRLPNCKDCHTSHTISRTDKKDFRARLEGECGTCHEEKAGTFRMTYHGKVSGLDPAGRVATCSSCHGTHKILPARDTRSTIHKGNLVQTCGQCHDASHPGFVSYLVHADPTDADANPGLHLLHKAMVGLLTFTFVALGLHGVLWLARSLIAKEWRHRLPRDARGPYVRRWRHFYSVLHIVMMLAFLTVATTGLPLHFAEKPWAKNLMEALGGTAVAGFIHRVAAIVMLAAIASFLVDLVRRVVIKREKGLWSGPNTMLPRWKDLQDVLGNLKWFLGRGEKPGFDRWTYWEKFDFWAVFWGIAIIGGSGLVLWFPETATRIFPGWIINAAIVIHGHEALLAVGFIFSIHVFHTQFRPEKFPMDVSFYTGRIPLEELKRERPVEYERALSEGTLEAMRDDEPRVRTSRRAHLLGIAALAVGLSFLVAMIAALIG